MTFADTLSPRERRRGRILACLACWFGCISEVMVDSSAIVILYIAMMGGSKSEAMLSTGFSAVFCMLAMIPCAVLVGRIGLKRAVAVSCLAGVEARVYDNATAPVGNHIAVLLEGIADKSLDLHDPKYTNKPAIACQRLQKSEREAELLYNSE